MSGYMATLMLEEEKLGEALLEATQQLALSPSVDLFDNRSEQRSNGDVGRVAFSSMPTTGQRTTSDNTEGYVILNFLEQTRKTSILI